MINLTFGRPNLVEQSPTGLVIRQADLRSVIWMLFAVTWMGALLAVGFVIVLNLLGKQIALWHPTVAAPLAAWNAGSMSMPIEDGPSEENLEFARRVLELGGALDLGDALVSNRAALPQGDFSVRGICFPLGTSVFGADLAELNIPATLHTFDLSSSTSNSSFSLTSVCRSRLPVRRRCAASMRFWWPRRSSRSRASNGRQSYRGTGTR